MEQTTKGWVESVTAMKGFEANLLEALSKGRCMCCEDPLLGLAVTGLCEKCEKRVARNHTGYMLLDEIRRTYQVEIVLSKKGQSSEKLKRSGCPDVDIDEIPF